MKRARKEKKILKTPREGALRKYQLHETEGDRAANISRATKKQKKKNSDDVGRERGKGKILKRGKHAYGRPKEWGQEIKR